MTSWTRSRRRRARRTSSASCSRSCSTTNSRRAAAPTDLQAKRFGEEIEAVLRRYELRQISSAEVVERLIKIAKRLRDSAHRHEELGLTEEEAAFYDALAGGIEHLRKDLSVDWTDREATEAKIRTKIKRLLRRNRDKLPKLQPATAANGTGGSGDLADGGINHFTQLVLDQANAMYRYWPEVGDQLFADA